MIDLAATLKRIAWAYGCARKGSSEEAHLRELLLQKARIVSDPQRCVSTNEQLR